MIKPLSSNILHTLSHGTRDGMDGIRANEAMSSAMRVRLSTKFTGIKLSQMRKNGKSEVKVLGLTRVPSLASISFLSTSIKSMLWFDDFRTRFGWTVQKRDDCKTLKSQICRNANEKSGTFI